MNLNRREPLYWVLLILMAVIVFILVYTMSITVESQEQDQFYEYDGWQHKTTLRSRTWNAADRPPEPNERLYIYRDGIQQDGYYQWNGAEWQPRGGAYYNKQEKSDEEEVIE